MRDDERVPKRRKRITESQQSGDRGHGFVHSVVTDMGFLWHPSGKNEAGIDGTIELRDPASGEVSAQVLLVQIKSTQRRWDHEDAVSFTYRVDENDLSYWLESNAPVVLVLVRLKPREAWWVSVREAFADPRDRTARRVRIDKRRDVFDDDSAAHLQEVVDRDRARRALATRSLTQGPYGALGLVEDLARAERATTQQHWPKAAKRWRRLLSAVEARRLEPRLVWPLLERYGDALERGGQRRAAGEIYLRLARERVEEDDAAAEHDVGRVLWSGRPVDFEVKLVHLRAEAPEAGIEILPRMEQLHDAAKGAKQRRASGAALVDALVFFGFYERAFAIADAVVSRRLDTPEKRRLALDRLDCAGELGNDVDAEWKQLIRVWRQEGPWMYGWALQRRGAYLARSGRAKKAHEQFARAAGVWGGVEGGEEQVAEAVLCAEAVNAFNGILRSDVPFGARQVAATARGSTRTAAARTDRLIVAGLGYLADHQRPDALQRLTLAAMADRRAGNLASWRRCLYLLARAYEDADEFVEAMRLWILVGAELRAAELAGRVEREELLDLLRIRGTPWEQAASFAALEKHAKHLEADAVDRVAAPTVEAAERPVGFAAPQPSFYARKTLARLAARLPAELAERAAKPLQEDVDLGAVNAPESASGLMALHVRGLIDAVPLLLDALLAGQDLPVTIAGWLREDAPEELQQKVVNAAIAGNQLAVAEAVRADLPSKFPELRALCDAAIKRALDASSSEHDTSFGVNFTELGELARFCRPSLRREFATTLREAVASPDLDELSKISALIATAIVAPALAASTARELLAAFLPLAEGKPPDSAPGQLRSHRNPKRARNKFTRNAPEGQLQSAAVQACARLARRGAPRSKAMGRALEVALVSGDTHVVRMALREMTELPDVRVRTDIQELAGNAEPEVARAAAELITKREEDRDGAH